MSSTNRGNARDYHVADYYVTPQDEIEIFIKELVKYEPDILKGRILDPAAGGDSEHEMSYPAVLKKFGCNDITSIDIRRDSKADIIADYLNYNCSDFNLVITNPPFSLAREYIEKALNDVVYNGHVIMLLRLNFLGSRKRKDLWDKQLPKYCFVHHKRMSFTNGGSTDSVEYAHFVWQKGYYPDFVKLMII